MGEKLKFRQLLNADENGYILYAVRYGDENATLRDLFNEILRQKTYGFISLKLHARGVDVGYRGTKILSKFDFGILDLPLKDFIVGAQGKQDRMDYLVEVKPYD